MPSSRADFKGGVEMGNIIKALAAMVLATGCAGAVAEPVKLYTTNYPPFQYQDGNQAKGMGVDLVNEVFRRMHRDVVIEVVPWPRVLRAVQEGESDGLFTVFWTAEREQYLDYCKESLIDQKMVFFVKKDSPNRIGNGADMLTGERLGLVNQISYGPVFDRQIRSGMYKKIEMSNNFEEAVKKLGAARFDVLVASEYVGKFYLQKQHLLGQVRQLPQIIEVVPSYLAFSKARNQHAMCDEFDKALQGMKKDGSYRAIVDSHVRLWQK